MSLICISCSSQAVSDKEKGSESSTEEKAKPYEVRPTQVKLTEVKKAKLNWLSDNFCGTVKKS
ncbi:MAG: hypothetical protein COZ18_16165 [Flexibacter sp. CG_4_10_14_3_um_filter_32_15]|nr:MAG: hypothetical protein COZ18_16165 [Flexibacter sp. CG_4_10_14_3_um_filter_32_15]